MRLWRTATPRSSHKAHRTRDVTLALFTDLEPDPRANPRTRWLGWGVLAFALVGVTVVALVPAPYVIEQPGPVFDVLGNVQVGGEDVPLIDIPTETTYPTDGTLDMLTVSVSGNRESLPTWLEIAGAYFDPSKAVLPIDDVYSLGITVDDSNEQAAVDMANSQREAIAAALIELGYTFPSTLTVVDLAVGGPSEGLLQEGDIVLSVDGETFADVTGLRAAIASHGVESPAEVVITRDGAEETIEITPELSADEEPAPILGIVVGSEYDFPIDVTIQLENVGGPSAGQMFALGIIDKLTPGQLNGGSNVAGTGTISASGEVGAIGGIRQKLYGARGAGAEFFLAPESNCDEVTGHVPAGLTVFAVQTLEDSLAVLEAVAGSGDISALPTCATG